MYVILPTTYPHVLRRLAPEQVHHQAIRGLGILDQVGIMPRPFTNKRRALPSPHYKDIAFGLLMAYDVC